MREDDLDIVEIILSNIPQNNEIQERIKLYIETHKSNCNDYIYTKYKEEMIYFNSIFKSIRSGLGSEIIRTLNKKDML